MSWRKRLASKGNRLSYSIVNLGYHNSNSVDRCFGCENLFRESKFSWFPETHFRKHWSKKNAHLFFSMHSEGLLLRTNLVEMTCNKQLFRVTLAPPRLILLLGDFRLLEVHLEINVYHLPKFRIPCKYIFLKTMYIFLAECEVRILPLQLQLPQNFPHVLGH